LIATTAGARQFL
jgi:hypothetical protein